MHKTYTYRIVTTKNVLPDDTTVTVEADSRKDAERKAGNLAREFLDELEYNADFRALTPVSIEVTE